VLLAPPKNHLMLPGITYDVVLELAAAHGLPVEVRDGGTEAEARGADELWMTSSTKEVLPSSCSTAGPSATGGTPGPGVRGGCTPGTRTSSDGDARR
jgi:D-alanine transaminase